MVKGRKAGLTTARTSREALGLPRMPGLQGNLGRTLALKPTHLHIQQPQSRPLAGIPRGPSVGGTMGTILLICSPQTPLLP